MSKTLRETATNTQTNTSDPRILLLALGMFALGTDAFVVAGVLPEIAHETRVSESLAGQVVTAFTLTYGLGAPVLAVLTSRWSHTRVLIAALGAFCLANLGSALAPTFPLLVLARIFYPSGSTARSSGHTAWLGGFEQRAACSALAEHADERVW
jgi:DHA1 family inner membrane transport protein